MGVRNADTKRNTFAAEFAFCHTFCTSFARGYFYNSSIISDDPKKSKLFLKNFIVHGKMGFMVK